jgi:putative addiction module killer protein
MLCIIYYTLYGMRQVQPLEIEVYRMASGRIPFEEWLSGRDMESRQIVRARLERVRQGLLGDTKYLDDGVYELRIFYGSGLRVYFGKSGSRLVVLLCAGNKATQKSDIKFARKYWKDWKENE